MKNIVILLVLIAGVICWQVKDMIYENGPLKEDGFVVIGKGFNSYKVAKALEQAKVIDKPNLFKLVARFKGIDKKLKAGEYNFEKGISLHKVIEKLNKGEVFYRKITIAEGITTKQALDIINAESMLEGEITIDVKEGEILPETYSFMRGESKDSIIKRAKADLSKVLEDAWENRDIKLPIKTKEDLLTLASIIEKETALEEERELVASVFVNRLKKGMRLQTDPTVIYAITKGQKDLGRPLYKKDLSIDSPYNTYKYYGLPPKPICNAGEASIRAAANPEISNYLYFVADGKGGHNFATSLKQHNRNVVSWKKTKK